MHSPFLSGGHGKSFLAIEVVVPASGCNGDGGSSGSGRSQIERRARVLGTGGCGGCSLDAQLVKLSNNSRMHGWKPLQQLRGSNGREGDGGCVPNSDGGSGVQ